VTLVASFPHRLEKLQKDWVTAQKSVHSYEFDLVNLQVIGAVPYHLRGTANSSRAVWVVAFRLSA
jgi:hypothetical protein